MLRRVSAALCVLGVVGLALLPPEHVHHAADHDHDAEVVHRHFEPHHAARPQVHVENPDEDATYLSSVFTLPDTDSLSRPALVFTAATLPAITAPVFTPWHFEKRDLRVHDPPWARALSLRGPPSLSWP